MKKQVLRIVIPLLLVAIAAGLSACNGRKVNALDYSLENELYGEQTQQHEAMNTEEDDNPADMPSPEESTVLTDMTENSEPVLFVYTLRVSDQNGTPLSNARVTLYADGAILYSAITDTDGKAAWTLPAGSTYTAKAEMEGFAERENNSHVSDNETDVTADIILYAVKPVESAGQTEKDDMSEPTATAIPVKNTEYSKVTISADNVSVKAGDASFSLLDGVSAVNEKGDAVTVWVVNDDGFSVNAPGEYHVSYAAMQGDNDMVSVSRTVSVIGSTSGKIQVRASVPSGSSEKRYKQLLAYRNEIYEALRLKIQTLTNELNDIIQELLDDNPNARLMKQMPLLEGDAEQEENINGRKIEMMGCSQIEKATVSNWSDILAVFIAKSSLEVDNPLDLMELRHISFDGLDEVFWDMVKIRVIKADDGTDVLLNLISYEEMANVYGLSEKRTNLLYELMQPEFQRVFASLTGNTAFDDMTSSEIREALSKLPEDISVEREKVVEMAYSLVGRVTYFWAGKYNALGWNPGWGLPRVVTSKGSKTTGKTLPYGLDCSGYVSWVFINASENVSVLNAIGNGSANQWKNSISVGWDEGKPGDLAFFAAPGEKDYNHVGIIVSAGNNGSYLVAHCSSSKNGVVITDAWSSGFRYLRRPILYKEMSKNES